MPKRPDDQLKGKATTALRWSALDQVLRNLITFAISVAMARLVAPEAYGIIALLMFFTGIAGVFVDGGLSSALIQKQNTSHIDESTVFWFNLATALVMASSLFLAAPWISRFYGIPVLLPITRIITIQFILGACNSIQTTLFHKKLDFSTLLKIDLVCMVFSATVGISLAWHGYGVWALVAQTMVGSVAQTLLIWKFSKWRPLLQFSTSSFQTLFSYGGYLFLSSILDTTYNRVYALIIGKLYGPSELGIYNRADSTKQLPTNALTGVLSRVAFPIFSQMADDPPRILRGLRAAIRGAMFINIPMTLGIACVAKPLILTLFGDGWARSIPILQILSIGALLWPLQVLNLNILKAMGHSSKFLKVEIIKKVLGLFLVFGGSFYGMYGMAWSVVVYSAVSFVINAHYTGRLLGYGAYKQAIDSFPAVLSGLGMTVAVLAISNALHFYPLFNLVILSTVGAISYFGFAKLFRVDEVTKIYNYLKPSLLKKLRS